MIVAILALGPSLLFGPRLVLADELDQPRFTPGESWVYHESDERGPTVRTHDSQFVIVRADGDDLLVAVKTSGSREPPRERLFHTDWSRFRGLDGVETIVNQPLEFPLEIGKTWKVAYGENHPNAARARQDFEMPWRVVGWEQVKTPAGEFRALKIEARGRWTADLTSWDGAHAPRRVEGRVYNTVWYVPEVKRWVRSVYELYDPRGELKHRHENLLVSHQAGNETPTSEPKL